MPRQSASAGYGFRTGYVLSEPFENGYDNKPMGALAFILPLQGEIKGESQDDQREIRHS
jgi:hypothetical protein